MLGHRIWSVCGPTLSPSEPGGGTCVGGTRLPGVRLVHLRPSRLLQGHGLLSEQCQVAFAFTSGNRASGRTLRRDHSSGEADSLGGGGEHWPTGRARNKNDARNGDPHERRMSARTPMNGTKRPMPRTSAATPAIPGLARDQEANLPHRASSSRSPATARRRSGNHV